MVVLNPQLYNALKDTFSEVGVTKPGEKAMVSHVPIWINERPRLNVKVDGGEYYKVINCPFCGDKRRRLHFNHLCGTHDDKTGRPIRAVV